jgi:hypothetical protein
VKLCNNICTWMKTETITQNMYPKSSKSSNEEVRNSIGVCTGNTVSFLSCSNRDHLLSLYWFSKLSKERSYKYIQTVEKITCFSFCMPLLYTESVYLRFSLYMIVYGYVGCI